MEIEIVGTHPGGQIYLSEGIAEYQRISSQRVSSSRLILVSTAQTV
jgi:hypothetical protein